MHYGQACMCPLSRLPARYVFGRRELDISGVAQALSEIVLGRGTSPPAAFIVIFLEHALVHHSESLQKELSAITADKVMEQAIRDSGGSTSGSTVCQSS